jgi:hypothetical protein
MNMTDMTRQGMRLHRNDPIEHPLMAVTGCFTWVRESEYLEVPFLYE